MSCDLTFKNIHCTIVGLEVMDVELPLFGEISDSFVKLPNVSGDFVIGDSTESDIEIRVQFLMTPSASQNYHDARMVVREYLKSEYKERLIFDEYPTYAYMAKFTGSDVTDRIVNEGMFWATFRCSPDMVAL